MEITVFRKPINKRLLVTCFSLSLIPFWGLSFLSAGDVNSYTAFTGLIGTFIAASYLRRKLAVGVSSLLYFFGPVIYLISALIIQRDNFMYAAQPLLVATAFVLWAIIAVNRFWMGALLSLVSAAVYSFLFFVY